MKERDKGKEEILENVTVNEKVITDETVNNTATDNESNLLDEGVDINAQSVIDKKRKRKKVIITFTSLISVFLVIILVLFKTRSGRKVLIDAGSKFITGQLDTVEAEQNEDYILFSAPTIIVEQEDRVYQLESKLRKEEYVANFLLAGLENIKGGARSDSMMIASINIKDNTIKLTSIMRDCYVEIKGHGNNKLNAAYSFGGINLLIDTIEQNFKIKIDGYATVNFESFEKIVDLLGGVDIELGKAEANYLNEENYISNPAYRNVKVGWNTLNGNQALGYARVRYVATLGGANNDYGRTLRQRRLLNAMFDQYKSKNFLELISIMYEILPEITTNLTASQLSDVVEQIVENSITTIENYRIPEDGYFQDAYKECGDVLILDFESNIQLMYQNIFLDEKTNN